MSRNINCGDIASLFLTFSCCCSRSNTGKIDTAFQFGELVPGSCCAYWLTCIAFLRHVMEQSHHEWNLFHLRSSARQTLWKQTLVVITTWRNSCLLNLLLLIHRQILCTLVLLLHYRKKGVYLAFLSCVQFWWSDFNINVLLGYTVLAVTAND